VNTSEPVPGETPVYSAVAVEAQHPGDVALQTAETAGSNQASAAVVVDGSPIPTLPEVNPGSSAGLAWSCTALCRYYRTAVHRFL